MNFKPLKYLTLPLLSLSIMTGCGDTASNTIVQTQSTEAVENIAVLIPEEAMKGQTKTAITKLENNLVSSQSFSKLIKDDAENGTDKWIVYDSSPAGASISTAYDDLKGSQVIELSSEGIKNGFNMGLWTAYPWTDESHKLIQWSMNYDEAFMLYVRISTNEGYRYMYYTAADYNYGVSSYDAPHYIHHGLGADADDGSWKTFTRDIEADLKEFDSDNTLISIDGFFIRGSGSVDDILLMNEERTSEPITDPIVEVPDSTPSITLDDAINAWAETNSKSVGDFSYLIGEKYLLNGDNSRVIIQTSDLNSYGSEEPNTQNSIVLDSSDLNNLKLLAENSFYRYEQPLAFRLLTNDYIMIAETSNLTLHNYTTGDVLSNISHDVYIGGVDYLKITNNYAIYSRMYNGTYYLTKADFTNRTRPIITDLYQTDNNPLFSLSTDETKILIKDTEGNLLQEVTL